MKRTRSRLLAAASAALLLAAMVLPMPARDACAAARPRYGGTLRIATRFALTSLHPLERARDASEGLLRRRLLDLVFERLVRFDETGQPRPALAVSWQHDAEFRQWQIRLRPGVKFHDGSVLTPSIVADSLAQFAIDWRVRIFGETLVIQFADPQPDLLALLDHSASSIVHRGAQGVLVGTGPFRLAQWEAERRAVLEAHPEYWGGRPFVDSIEVQMGRSPRDQLTDFELGRVDIIEVQPEQQRRATQVAAQVWSSAPVELLALVPGRGTASRAASRLAEALSLAIDRNAMQQVLLQRQGEIADGILPQWISGYAFLFSVPRDVERARQVAAELFPAARAVVLGYDSQDLVMRMIAERIAVDARQAGIQVQVTGQSEPEQLMNADWILGRAHVLFAEGQQGTATAFVPDSVTQLIARPGASPDAHATERDAMAGASIVPLLHLRETFALGPRVKNWLGTRWGDWRLADVWLMDGSLSPAGEEKP